MSKAGCIALACISAWIILVILGESGISVGEELNSLKALIKKYQVEGFFLMVIFWVVALWPDHKNKK